jgi:hypothetical protein
MQPPISPLLFSLLLFCGMLVLLEVGRQLGLRRHTNVDAERGGLGAVEGAVFALFGLLLAFTFSGAASRFNEKRWLVADEANGIGTAYLRLQLVPEGPRHDLQELFRRYVDSRIETYRRLPDMAAAEIEMVKSRNLQNEIWTAAVVATKLPDSHPDSGKLLLPALNGMIDITTTRGMALQIHPPRIIYTLLFGLGLLCSLLAGYRMASDKRSWLHILGFTVITVVVAYVILDVEYPRGGLIHIQTADQFLVRVREDMK